MAMAAEMAAGGWPIQGMARNTRTKPPKVQKIGGKETEIRAGEAIKTDPTRPIILIIMGASRTTPPG